MAYSTIERSSAEIIAAFPSTPITPINGRPNLYELLQVLKYLCRCPHSPFAEAGLAANDCINKARVGVKDGDALMPSGAGRGCVRKERVLESIRANDAAPELARTGRTAATLSKESAVVPRGSRTGPGSISALAPAIGTLATLLPLGTSRGG